MKQVASLIRSVSMGALVLAGIQCSEPGDDIIADLDDPIGQVSQAQSSSEIQFSIAAV